MKRVWIRCAVLAFVWFAAMVRPPAAQTASAADALQQQLAEMDSRLERQRAELQALRELVAKITPELATLQKSVFQQLDKLVPVGTVVMYYGQLSALPDNWALCAGQALPSTIFPTGKAPDFRKRFARGASDEAGARLGDIGGVETVANHYHNVSGSSSDVFFPIKSINGYVTSYSQTTAADGLEFHPDLLALSVRRGDGVVESHGHSGGTATFTGTSDRDGGHDNRPPFQAVHYIVRVK
jgi:hypothetical protein